MQALLINCYITCSILIYIYSSRKITTNQKQKWDGGGDESGGMETGGGGGGGGAGGGNITRTVSSLCTAFSVLMKPLVVMTIVVSDGRP